MRVVARLGTAIELAVVSSTLPYRSRNSRKSSLVMCSEDRVWCFTVRHRHGLPIIVRFLYGGECHASDSVYPKWDRTALLRATSPRDMRAVSQHAHHIVESMDMTSYWDATEVGDVNQMWKILQRVAWEATVGYQVSTEVQCWTCSEEAQHAFRYLRDFR